MCVNKLKYILCFIIIITIMSSCYKDETSEVIYTEFNRITCIFPRENSGFWNELSIGLENNINNNSTIDIKFDYRVVSKNLDEMILDLEYAYISNVDVIVAADYMEDSEYKKVIEKAKNNGITVILINPEFFQFKDISQIGNIIYNQILFEINEKKEGL